MAIEYQNNLRGKHFNQERINTNHKYYHDYKKSEFLNLLKNCESLQKNFMNVIK